MIKLSLKTFLKKPGKSLPSSEFDFVFILVHNVKNCYKLSNNFLCEKITLMISILSIINFIHSVYIYTNFVKF
jgi:hypothetical protein